jgi:hypothetical protein
MNKEVANIAKTAASAIFSTLFLALGHLNNSGQPVDVLDCGLINKCLHHVTQFVACKIDERKYYKIK